MNYKRTQRQINKIRKTIHKNIVEKFNKEIESIEKKNQTEILEMQNFAMNEIKNSVQ